MACHGRYLRETEGGNSLMGERFISRWRDKSFGELFELTKATMPKTNPHSLDDASYSALLAFILNANEFPSGKVALYSKKAELQYIVIGTPPASSKVNMAFTPHTYDRKPPTIEGEWLQHCGDYTSTNYSPLDQGGGNKFRSYDKATGKIMSTIELPANQCGLPMTYSINGKQYIVIAVGAVGHPGELVALSL